jgi:hypothetical protein
MDSLLAVRLLSYIGQLMQKARPSSPPAVPRNVVYDHPSISALARFILSSVSTDETKGAEDDIKARFCRSVERFTSGLAPRSPKPCSIEYKDGEEFVVVTGTTGSLGSFLLDQLMDRPSVKRIYCFNRRWDVETVERQLAAFVDRRLESGKLRKFLGSRVILHDVDLSQSRFGLSNADYEEVKESELR